MKNVVILLLFFATTSLLSSCVSCDDREVVKNRVYRNTTLWGKQSQESFRISLPGSSNNYGTFQITQEGKQIMALDFTSVLSNNGREISFAAEPRKDLLTDWQLKRMKEDADYTVTVQLDQQGKQYVIKLRDVPPGYEEEYGNQTVILGMFLPVDKVNDYFNQIEFEEMKQANGSGASLYFGTWVNFIYQHLFWLYAVVFAIFALGRGKEAFWRHVILTAIFFATFKWDFAPARAFIISYYLCEPMLYLPFIKNKIILYLSYGGAVVSMLFLAYKTWAYLGLLEWAFYIVLWGAIAIVTAFLFLDDLTYRCFNCGRFALGWRGRTDRFEKAVDHYKNLAPDGSDTTDIVEDPQTIHLKRTRCAHCMAYCNGDYDN